VLDWAGTVKRTERFGFLDGFVTWAALRTVAPLVAGVLAGISAELFPQQEIYADLSYGFSLLAFLGAACGVFFLAALLSRRFGGAAPAGFRIIEIPPPSGALGTGAPGESADWPVLVALLLGSFFVLISGLGGWV
jgi:hypothetical protein